MKRKIIVDSCCDLTPSVKERFGVTSVPLTMHLGDKEFVDDDELDKANFMDEMAACKGRVGSASPASILYQEVMESLQNSFVITLSSKLSGSYDSARMAQKAAEENPEVKTHVFDSKSASAGETLLAIKLGEILERDTPDAQIVPAFTRFIDEMKTYFVLENYDNLRKNGRLGLVTEKLISVLGIRMLMGTDGCGNIAVHGKARGAKQIVEKMLGFIEKSGKKCEGENLVISHCNNPELAQRLSAAIEKRFPFKEIFVVPTGGLSSLYADNQGLVMAY